MQLPSKHLKGRIMVQELSAINFLTGGVQKLFYQYIMVCTCRRVPQIPAVNTLTSLKMSNKIII